MSSCSRAERLVLPELGWDVTLPMELEARRGLARDLLDRLKTLDATAQERLIARLEHEWDMPRAQGHPHCRPMGWDDLREMHRGGMEIGSHGVAHRMLAKLDTDDMQREVADSKRTLQRELGADVQAMSYPVGGPDAYDAGVIDTAREVGYRLACSYLAGTDAATQATRYELRRLPVERYMDAPWFEALMAVPEVFGHRSRTRNG